MKNLVVGLGNPEGKYFKTYHNAGFICADLLASHLGITFTKKGNQLLAKSGNTLILKPLTYMNQSGRAVVAAVRKHKPSNIIVLVDDIYIDKGNIRVSFGGSSGGHNGLKSITQLMGSGEYIKIRIGIKPEKDLHDYANYVLSKIDNPDTIAFEKAVLAAQALLNDEPLAKVQNMYNEVNRQ